MFLVEHFKALVKKLKSEKARIKREKEEELERKKPYWEISKLLYQAILSASKESDGKIVYEHEGAASPVISILSYQVDEKLSLKIKMFIPDCLAILGYEVDFYIDGVLVDYDLENYKKLSILVLYDLKGKLKAHKEKKATMLDDYLAWREKNVQKSSNEQPKPALPIKCKDVTLSVDVGKPLSTNAPLSKDQLIEYLQKADIPGDAECTLQFDEGKFYLYFYWSEDAGAFGNTAVNFDIESKELVEDAWSYMVRKIK